jgi:polyvinyl alcohol dehydrogenase (cytochrome)
MVRTGRTATGAATLLVLLAAGCATATGPGGSSAPGGQVTTRPAQESATPEVPPAGGSASAGPATQWPMYHQNPQRTGVAVGLPAAGALSLAWSTRLGGEVAGQPVIIGNTVVAATEADTVFGLNRTTGRVRWRARIGTPLPLSRQPCGNLNPLGITGTPVYDPADKLVYVVAQDGRTRHVLAGIRLSDGKVAVTRDIPAPDHQPAFDQQRGALALSDRHIYVVFGGHYGDCGPYIGSVVAVPSSGRGPIWSYRVPTAKQGGIWAAGGPVVSKSGTIFVSAGNGASTRGPFDGTDSVTALTSELKPTGIFAPTDWRMLSADDLDLGSMSPALISDGRILQVGKSGIAYLLSASHLGGVGGQLAQAHICTAFGGAAVSGTIVYVPCQDAGLTAVQTAGNRIAILWRAAGGAFGSPVIGGGAIWVAGPDDGVLYELAPATGAVRHRIQVAGLLPDFVSPSLSGRLILIGTMTGVTAVAGA